MLASTAVADSRKRGLAIPPRFVQPQHAARFQTPALSESKCKQDDKRNPAVLSNPKMSLKDPKMSLKGAGQKK